MFRHTHTRDRSSWQLHMAPKPHPAENVWFYGLSVPWCTPNFMTISWRKYEEIRKSSTQIDFSQKKTSPDIATDSRKPSHLFRSESADSRVHLGGKLQGPPCNWWDPVAGHFLIRLATWKDDMENSMENSVDSIGRPFTSTLIMDIHGYSWIFLMIELEIIEFEHKQRRARAFLPHVATKEKIHWPSSKVINVYRWRGVGFHRGIVKELVIWLCQCGTPSKWPSYREKICLTILTTLMNKQNQYIPI